MLHKTIKQVTNDIEQAGVQHGDLADDGVHEYFTKQSCGRARSWRSSCCFSRRSLRTSPKSCGNCWATTARWPIEPWPKLRRGVDEGRGNRDPRANHRQAPRQGRRPRRQRQATLVAAAREDERIAELLTGKEVVKTIVVPGKLVNFVVK